VTPPISHYHMQKCT